MEINRGDLSSILKSVRREGWQEVKEYTKTKVNKNKKKYNRKDKSWRNLI